MANFKTHVSVTLLASSTANVVVVNGGLFYAEQSASYVVLGLIGGLLPDIDSDHSRQVRHLFTGLGLCCAGVIWQTLEDNLSQRLIIPVALLAFGVVRYLLMYLFQRMTVHRGVFHSVLAGIFFALLLVCIRYYSLATSNLDAWLGGVFLLFGFIVHLCLDELFSVDLANGRMKKSFGTALKVYGYQNPAGSILLLSLTTALLLIAPSTATLFDAVRLFDWAHAAELGPLLTDALNDM
ncbi:metal-dependent hydrolase [Methylomonas sp. MgM2]